MGQPYVRIVLFLQNERQQARSVETLILHSGLRNGSELIIRQLYIIMAIMKGPSITGKRVKNSFMDIFVKARDKFDANL